MSLKSYWLITDQPTARDTYQALVTELSQLKVLSLPANLGSAEGFSAGIKDFLANGKTAYLWVLDDDNCAGFKRTSSVIVCR